MKQKLKIIIIFLANRIYTKEYRDLFKNISNDLNEPIKDGVYSSLGGPCYETVTELRGLAQLGADCAGMSTAHEVYFIF
jgi:purine-nucleoside phosphorylase